MAHQANSRGRTGSATAAALARGPLRFLAVVFASSRIAVAVAAGIAAVSLDRGGLGARNSAAFDSPDLTGALGEFFAGLARWDAVWFLEIAATGYDREAQTAFFPLYPLLVAAASEVGGGSAAARLFSAEVLSLAAFAAALVLLFRLAELELGARRARATVALVAFFPAGIVFGAPYSESLYLLLSVGAFLAARQGRWAWAGLAAAGASATRSAGILLLVPLLILLLYGPRADRRADRPPRGLRPRFRPGREAAWLLLAPAGVGAYALYLGLEMGDAFAFVDAQGSWSRELTVPLAGVWEGAAEAADGVETLVSGVGSTAPIGPQGGPRRLALMQILLFASLVFAAVAAVGAARRLPPAYSAYAGAALALPLSFPAAGLPLMSLPRFLAVLFPLFMWLAIACERRGATPAVVVVSAIGLVAAAAEFGAVHFVA